ncbi:MAG: tyrosine--tRNA ligase [bacterium]|nr:tyrosine--tRNA ligase [bacterium]
MNKKNSQIEILLTRGVPEIIVQDHLRRRLLAGEILRLKLGIDPTGYDLHLGHMVPLRALRRWQIAGHKIVIIIGDYTAQIGDPSGQDKTRPSLTHEKVLDFAKDYLKQIFKILDEKKTEIRYQAEWFQKFNLQTVFELCSKCTVKQMLARETFRERLKKDAPFSIHEMLYPLLQGFDSVAIKADVEFGGIEQKFNLLVGRDIQRSYGQTEQDIVMTPILVGTDGKEKMSKSLNNYIGILESPFEIYGKVMSIPDSLIMPYFELCADIKAEELTEIKNELERVNPKIIKARLAREIVALYHSLNEAKGAEKEFEKVFKAKEAPQDISVFKIKEKKLGILDLLTRTRLAPSKSEAKRLVTQGAVEIDNQKITDWRRLIALRSGLIIKAGKRKFAKIE